MNAYKRYLEIKDQFGWACKIADEFGWEASNELVEYDCWKEAEENKFFTELEKQHKKTLREQEQKFIDEFLSIKENAEWAKQRRIAHLEKTNPKSIELKMLKDNKIVDTIDDSMIERAKEYPIPDMLGEPTMNKYQCIWHDDQNPSMHFYEKTNSVHCFSCGGGGDSIAVAMKLYNINFKEAVKNLN